MRKGKAVALLALLGAYRAVGQVRPATSPVSPPAPGAVIVLDTPAPQRFTGETISLDLKDADIRDVLKAFAKIGRFNLAVDPEVRGSVTVRLQNVPWDQALDVILRMNGLGYTMEGRVLRTGTPWRLADP
jgi:type IV pilus assembly protein PilQ